MNDRTRHLKRKFLQIKELPQEVLDVINSAPSTKLTKEEKKEKKQTILISEKGHFIKAFTYNTIPIPTAHPVTVYYDMALRNVVSLTNKKNDVLQKARANLELNDVLSSIFYYFGTASIFASQLTTSIECFINLLIKNETKYSRQKDSKELIGNEIIWIPLKEKIEFLTPQLTSKFDFNKKFPNDLEKINALIDFRNDCIHPQKDNEFAMENYENLFRGSLSFKYEAALDAVKNFINYYSDFIIIEECFCYLSNNTNFNNTSSQSQ